MPKSASTFIFITGLVLLVVPFFFVANKQSNQKIPTMAQEINPPEDVTHSLFTKWRDARRGKYAAEDMSNPYWTWLVRSGLSSWAVNEHFKGPSSYGGNPSWSAERFGQSSTTLPDGRTLLIAGEHEDHYDPDFFIYNDIIVKHPDQKIEVLAFPENVFPPTDFHSATVVKEQIILIGNLGYVKNRKVGKTQILVINPHTWEIVEQGASGDNPGWIHSHQATLADGFIMITGGLVWSDNNDLIENFDDWRLNLTDWTWERLSHRSITIFEYAREDGEPNQLFEIHSWIFQQKFGSRYEAVFQGVDDPSLLAELRDSMKGIEPKNIDLFERRYRPDGIKFTLLPELEDSIEFRIEVEGVTVRYQENYNTLKLIIEGELKDELANHLRDDLKSKLEGATGKIFSFRKLKP